MLRSWSVRLSLLALALVALGPLLAYTGLVPGGPALGMYAAGGFLGLVAVVAGLVAAVRGRVRFGITATVVGLVAFDAVLLPIMQRGGASNPPINDVSTDLEDVPPFNFLLGELGGRDLAYPDAFRPLVRQHYPDLRPLTLPEPPDDLFTRALALARAQRGWTVTHVDRRARMFEAVATSRIFRLQDDIVVRVRPEADGARLDMRSRSRTLRGDLGANAERIRHFLGALGRPAGGQAPAGRPERAG
jgi:hypothetical protein